MLMQDEERHRRCLFNVEGKCLNNNLKTSCTGVCEAFWERKKRESDGIKPLSEDDIIRISIKRQKQLKEVRK